MPRPPVSLLPPGYFHVVAHAVDRQVLFRHDGDRRLYVSILDRAFAGRDVVVLTFCLMGNHVHMCVRSSFPALSEAMHELQGGYAAAFNRRCGRGGHLFKDRYWRGPIRTERHLLAAIRYIALNPLHARLCARPEQWRFSAHRALIGLAPPPPFLAFEEVLGLFASVRSYEEFVAGEDPPEHAAIAAGKEPLPGDIVAAAAAGDDAALLLLSDDLGHPIAAIARAVGCSRPTASRRVQRARERFGARHQIVHRSTVDIPPRS